MKAPACAGAGEVCVELASWIGAVMGIDAPGGAAEAAGSEELSVRRGSKAAAEDRRQRLAPLMIEETPQGEGVGLVANMPIGNPGELTEAGRSCKPRPCASGRD